MERKIFCILACFVLLTAVFGTVTSKEIPTFKSKSIEIMNEEVLDQYQNISNNTYPMVIGRINVSSEIRYLHVAQSFIPQKEILTKAEILIKKNASASKDLNVAIRDNLTGENLVEKSISPSEIETDNSSWVEIDLPDLFVDVGETYYLVCYTQNVTDNYFEWESNNNSFSYENGEAWYSLDNGSSWSNKSKSKSYIPKPRSLSKLDDTNISIDMCFKTYGRDATQLDIDFQMVSKGLKTFIHNMGSVNATDVNYKINISGGILGLINNETSGTITEPLQPGGDIQLNSSFFGFGFVEITVEVYASNVLKTTETTTGFVFFSYIFIKKPLI